MTLAGKWGVVTGAGSGMGQAIAWALAKEGAQIVAIGRTLAKLQATAEKSPVAGAIIPLPLDVADRIRVNEALAAEIARRGTPAFLVNNAGLNIRDRTVAKLRADDFDKVIQTNLTGAFNITHAILPAMLTAHEGLIINISSVAGLRPLPLAGAAYSASKYALNGFMQTLAREVAPSGIRCTTICPGEVATPILDERPTPVSAEQRAAMLQPTDIAEAVLFVSRLPPRAHVQELVMKPLVQDYG